MVIESLTLKGFRNIEDSTLETSSDRIILTGKNGQGKTNLLEAVYVLCYGSSFRTQNMRDLIKNGSDALYLKCVYRDKDGLERKTEFSYDGKTKLIRMDGSEIHDRKALIYTIPCIVFSHDDMEIIRGEPENRRRFFDQIMTMYDPVFFDCLRKYRTVLRQRNLCVREGRSDLLDVYDISLASYGKPLMDARQRICTSFSSVFPDIYASVSMTESNIEISYRPSWDCSWSDDEICRHLRKQRETDFKMGTTTSGPHRDRFVISDEKGYFTNTASTGQIRLASLIMRSAQAVFYRQKTDRKPVFLIDDVLLELDNEKRMRFLQCLGKYDQAFFTFLPGESYFSSIPDNSFCYEVKDGVFYG